MQNTLKKIILILIILVIGLGVFFGVKFYNVSKNPTTSKPTITNKNTNPNRTPFQNKTNNTKEEISVTGISTEVEKEVENPTNNTITLAKPRLIQLSKDPVSGFDFINKDIEFFSTSTATTTGTTTIFKKTVFKNQSFIYFWDRASGNIYENLASTSEKQRLSNYTKTQAQEVYFLSPTTILSRQLAGDNQSILTSYINLYKETATSTLYTAKEKPLYVNSDSISLSKEDGKMFYFIKKTGQAILSNLDLSSSRTVLKTSITELLPQYINKNLLAAATKPSAYFQGYLFFINPNNNTNEYILGDKYGFTTLVSPDGKNILYNYIEDDILQTSIYNINSKNTVYLSQSTLVEKCIWTNDSKKIYCAIPQKLALAAYPDVWYQGTTSFSDNIWSIDVKTGEFKVVIPLQDQVTEPIDAYNIKISPDQKHMLFQDKYTLSLWKYDL